MYQHDEDENARHLLAPLAGAPTGPSAVDLRRAMAVGQRRVWARRMVGVGAVAGATTLVAASLPVALDFARGPDADPPLAAPTDCRVEPLPVPEWTDNSWVDAGDPTGRYLVGSVAEIEQDEYAQSFVVRSSTLLWVDGEMTMLDIPYDSAIVDVVSSSGVIAGSAKDGSRSFSWVYENGEFTELPHSDHNVVDINTHGDILGMGGGSRHPDDPWSSQGVVPVIWPAGNRDAMRTLPLPAEFENAFPKAIGDDQTVVGTLMRGNIETGREEANRAQVWTPDGTPHELPMPDGYDPDRSAALDIRDGWVVGSVYHSQRRALARWHLPSGEVHIGSELAGWSVAINAQGWLAGHIEGSGHLQRPAIEVAGRLLELPYPPKAEPTIQDHGALTISDDGRVVSGIVMYQDGYGPNDNPENWDTEPGPPRWLGIAVRWTCQ